MWFVLLVVYFIFGTKYLSSVGAMYLSWDVSGSKHFSSNNFECKLPLPDNLTKLLLTLS